MSLFLRAHPKPQAFGSIHEVSASTPPWGSSGYWATSAGERCRLMAYSTTSSSLVRRSRTPMLRFSCGRLRSQSSAIDRAFSLSFSIRLGGRGAAVQKCRSRFLATGSGRWFSQRVGVQDARRSPRLGHFDRHAEMGRVSAGLAILRPTPSSLPTPS